MENNSIFNKYEKSYITYLDELIKTAINCDSGYLSIIGDEYEDYKAVFNYDGNVEILSTSFYVDSSLLLEDVNSNRKIIINKKVFAYDIDSDGYQLSFEYIENGNKLISKKIDAEGIKEATNNGLTNEVFDLSKLNVLSKNIKEKIQTQTSDKTKGEIMKLTLQKKEEMI